MDGDPQAGSVIPVSAHASWYCAHASVAGTAHEGDHQGNEDWCETRAAVIDGRPALVLGLADGCGSASHGGMGARLAVDTMLRMLASESPPVERIDRGHLLGWLNHCRHRIEVTADEWDTLPQDWASTLLVAVLEENGGWVMQIGDGAWVAQSQGRWGVVTWPDEGDFAGETTFVTSPDAAERLQFRRLPAGCDRLAGLTDGLQRLVLNHASRTPHVPFFKNVFAQADLPKAGPELGDRLASFLNSDPVNRRTADDKTLLLACRAQVVAESEEAP